MTPRERKLLSDIHSAARRILVRTADKTLEDYVANEDLRLVVERLFTILGEAATRLKRDHLGRAAQVPAIAGPIAFRNSSTSMIRLTTRRSGKSAWRM